MPEPATDFAAWEARLGFSSRAEAAEALGISRQAATDLHAGRSQPSPPTRRLMKLLESSLLRQHGEPR